MGHLSAFADDGERSSEDEWIAHLDLNGTDFSMKLDIGTQVNILFHMVRNKNPNEKDI